MDLKRAKFGIIAIFIMAIMLGSTFAYSILQSGSKSGENTIEIPTSKIIESELTTEQENYLLTQGKTIIKYYYNLKCDDCLRQKNLMESITNTQGFSDQIIVEEINTNEGTIPRIIIKSYMGQDSLTNYKDDDIINSLCKLMFKPPVGCIVREV